MYDVSSCSSTCTVEHRRTYVPAADGEVLLQEVVVEDAHVLLLGEEHVIGDVLHDLAHERQASLHARRRLLVDDARLARRH